MRKAQVKTVIRKDGQMAVLYRGRVMAKLAHTSDVEAFLVGFYTSQYGIDRIEQRDSHTHTLKHTHDVSIGLARDISRYNTYLGPAEVIRAIGDGLRVYTSFSYYQKAQ
jgi:hypothetical protein